MTTLRVAMLSYPMLFQRTGGLQVQINETIHALRALGVDARLAAPERESLADYDIVHVFGAINGNHRIVETGRSLGRGVVLSPLIRPSWTRFTGWRERWLDRLAGRLTGWHLQTGYGQILAGLQLAHKLIALGETERQSIVAAFGIDDARVAVIENGVTQRFFDATPDAFRSRFGIAGPFVLNVAAINPHKNQLALAKAMQGTGVPLVLIGECLSEHRGYLAEVSAATEVHYLGRLAYDDPALPSAYAAATVFALPSESEVMPLSVMEALAAGTPAVMTNAHSMKLPAAAGVVQEHAPHDVATLRRLLAAALAQPAAPEQCRHAVAHLRWSGVAEQLLAIYEAVLAETGTSPRVVAERGAA
jgi:glycosyltransferase involved in cell wall biosynthesis